MLLLDLKLLFRFFLFVFSLIYDDPKTLEYNFPTIRKMHAATSLFKMLLKYRPEDKAAKKERLLKKAQVEAEGKSVEAKKPIVVKYGLNHVTYLIEQVLIYFARR